MADILKIINWLLPLLYLALLIDYGAAFFLRTSGGKRGAHLAAVLAAHVLFLVLLAYHLNRLVPANSYEMLSVLAAATGVVYCVVELSTKDRRSGAFVLLAVFLLQYTSTVFLPRAELSAGATGGGWQGSWTGFHILPSLVAYTGFTLAAIYGLLHLLARRDLKRHRVGLLFDRLPSLETLGTMTWHALLLGFLFITVAIVSGAVMFHAAGESRSMDAKTLSKILAGTAAWIIYAGAVVGKALGKWAPSRVSWVAVFGFIIVAAMLVAGIVLS